MLSGIQIAIASTIGIILISLLLLGLPGAIIFELVSAPLIRLLFGVDALTKVPPDSTWPIAIYLSILCPISIVPGYWIAFKVFSSLTKPGQIAIFISFLLLWSWSLSICFYLLSRREV